MARATPRVEDGILRVAEGDRSQSVPVGAPAWFAWLAGATTFAYAAPAGGFTARQEAVGHGRGGRYWKAYRRHGGQLHRAYLGRSEDLTLARLESAAAALTGRTDGDPKAPPTNLPATLTSFVGREGALAELAALLPTTRLLTLAGPGGVGKTRLALEAARGAQADYPDGVWLVDLAPLADPLLVEHAVAAALRVADRPGRPLLAALTGWLAGKRLLLVLDNCEHLRDAGAALAEALLRACPELRLLATSREPLGVAGETTWRVPSLALPDPSRPPSPAALTRAEAVRLFVDRARASRPGFAVTTQNAAAVAEVCRRVDGIPLALELAAARIRALAPAELAARLDDRFRLLTGGNRAALPRQQTLRATLDWSHDLLAAPERALLRRLAVFAGGWTLAAAEAVGAGEGIAAAEVLDLLTGLVDKSLAHLDEGLDGAARYRLLETVRQYAAEQLAEAGEAAAVRDRHAAWCLALAERAEDEIENVDQVAWLARLDAERDNLRAALAWSLAADPDAGLRLAAHLRDYWFVRAAFTEGRGWLERLLERAPARTRWRARALLGFGRLLRAQGELTAARARFDESLAVSRELGEQGLASAALRNLGNVFIFLGEYRQARAALDEAIALGRRLEDDRQLGLALIQLGRLAQREGEYARARALLEEGLPLMRAIGNRYEVALVALNLGNVAGKHGEAARAEALLDESLALAREAGAPRLIASALCQLGALARNQGDLERAVARCEAGLAVARDHEDRHATVWLLVDLGWTHHRRADPERARTAFDRGLALAREMGDRSTGALALHGQGLVALSRGDPARAAALLGESLVARQELGERLGIAACLEGLAAMAAGTGRAELAARLLGAAGALRQAIGAPLPPVERPDHDATIRQTRAALGEAVFAAAWAAGRALTVEQAAAEALGDPSLPPADERAAPVPPAAPNGLSRREVEVLRLVAAGRSNRGIAEDLSVSVRTVERHITNLYGKIGARNRADAATFAIRHALA